MLRAGLSHELLDRLVTTDEPEGWEGFVELCKKVDRKMRALGPRATLSQPPRPTSCSALPPALALAPAPAPAQQGASIPQPKPPQPKIDSRLPPPAGPQFSR